MDELTAALMGAAVALVLELVRALREARLRRRGQLRTRADDQGDGQRTDI